jgi:Zn-dependent protease with chaperone function
VTHTHGGLLVALVAIALGALVANLLVAGALASLGRRRLTRLAPAEATRVALLGLSLPALLAGLALAVVLIVPALALRFHELDHCAAHLGAPHICFVHGTLDFLSVWEIAGVTVLLGALAAALLHELARLWRGRRLVAELVTQRLVADVNWTDDDEPYAFTVGLLKPRVIVASGLRTLLTAEQLDAAIEHERAHVRHRDALVRVLARVASFLLAPPLRRSLSELLISGQEKRADAEAARSVGSAALVADTLVALYRAHARPTAALAAPALVGPGLAERVRALCDGHGTERLANRLVLATAALCCGVVTAHASVHHSAEAIASVLLSSPVHAHADADAGALSHITQE